MNISYNYRHYNEQPKESKEKSLIIEIKEDNQYKVPCNVSFIDSEGCVRLIKKGTATPLYFVGMSEDGGYRWGTPDGVYFIDSRDKLNEFIDSLPDDGKMYLTFVKNKDFYEQGKLIRNLFNGGMH